ncbi:MAG: ABC-F family ATP-binding cassette domain-containing protein [Thermoguttaceae bacterium]|jgi:ATP-binding cassette subfamily F protein 3
MILLEVESVRKHFGPEPVLDGVSFNVRPGERIGLVGPNGCGKTTLLRILAGRDEPDGGACRVHSSVHLGFLEQQAKFEPGQTLYDEAKTALAALIALQEEALAVAEQIGQSTDPVEHKRLAARYDHLQHELHSNDAYNLDHKIQRVLDGLGFDRNHFDQPVASISGGEQNRLMLAKLLLAEPNLMILDEPSNHLDLAATEWLEVFLLEASAALIVVSHDRYFLDKVTNRTLELFHGTVEAYPGNFSAYWRQKAERLLVQRRTFDKQKEEIEKTKDFIRRNAYGMKHAQAEDRRKKLERLEAELVAPPREIAAPAMAFPPAARGGDIVVRAEHVAKSYNRTLFDDLSIDIVRSQCWALLGPNGCGKTTLLRCLLGLELPDAGNITLGQGLAVGYFDQQLAVLDDDAAVVDAIRPERKQLVMQQRRDLLARFGITGDTALQQVSSLSGGERCRAALARLSADEANFLVLDEPTNHLDIWARNALERAIKNFDGTVLLVSHDRYFLNRVADHLLVFEPDGVRVIEGNYDEYQLQLKRKSDEIQGEAGGKDQPKSGKAGQKSGKPSKKEARHSCLASSDKSSKKPAKKRRFPFRKVSDLEDEIFIRETLVQEFQKELAQPETQRNGDRVRSITAKIAEEQESLKTLYEHWNEATELNW